MSRGLGLLRAPLLWLFLGPPAIRGLGERDALASLQGDLDIWNLVRLGWWALFGLVALLDLYRDRRALARLLRRVPTFAGAAALWVGALLASALVSPAPLFTFVNAAMIAVLLIASLDLALKLHTGVLSAVTVLRWTHGLSLGLLGLIAVLLIFIPDLISFGIDNGIRVRNGDIADSSLLPLIIAFTALFLAGRASAGARALYLVAFTLALVFLLLAQTRTSYVAFVVGMLVMAPQWLQDGDAPGRRRAVGALSLLTALILAIPLYGTIAPSAIPVDRGVDYLLREERSLRSASGRDAIFAVVWSEVQGHPLGLGFSAGPRLAILRNATALEQRGVIASRIGNAHNAFLEVLGGGGFVALGAWLALLLWLAVAMRRAVVRGAAMRDAAMQRARPVHLRCVQALFAVYLVAALTGSDGVLPFTQLSGLFWIVAALTVAAAAATPRPNR